MNRMVDALPEQRPPMAEVCEVLGRLSPRVSGAPQTSTERPAVPETVPFHRVLLATDLGDALPLEKKPSPSASTISRHWAVSSAAGRLVVDAIAPPHDRCRTGSPFRFESVPGAAKRIPNEGSGRQAAEPAADERRWVRPGWDMASSIPAIPDSDVLHGTARTGPLIRTGPRNLKPQSEQLRNKKERARAPDMSCIRGSGHSLTLAVRRVIAQAPRQSGMSAETK